ncbi:MAG: hypothetical protein LBC31_09365 [Treponema sp.]|jgi:hypothetical protein|nr:hypothetical protein [Treponema sp.]
MSDIYADNRPGRQGSRQQPTRPVTGPDLLREEYAKAGELKTQIETKRIATQTPDFYLPGLTARDYARVYEFVDSGQITVNNAELQLIAESIAKQKNLEVDDVINNFDVFLSQMGVDPAKKDSAGFFQGVVNEFRAGQIQSQVDRLWREYRNAMDNDNPELAEGLRKDIDALSREANQFRGTFTPGGNGILGTLLAPLQKGALYASGSTVYMAQIMFGSLAAGGAGGFYMGWEANRDKEYGRQIEAGVKHDYAKTSSNLVAAGQSAVELLLGRGVGKLAGTITGSNIATELAGKFAGDVVKKIGLTGAPYVLGKFLLGTLTEAAGEGAEEVI